MSTVRMSAVRMNTLDVSTAGMSTAGMRSVDISPAVDITPLVHTSTAPGRAAPTATTRFRLTRRGRIVLTTIVATPMVIAAVMLALGGGIAAATTPGAASGATPGAVLQTELVSYRYVSVAPVQTLWDLAEQIAPTADPRDVIVDIVELNQLQGEFLQPGQRLALPAGY